MVHIAYKTRVDGSVEVKCATLKEAFEKAYETACVLPMDHEYLPIVSVFDNHGFVARIDRVEIEKLKIVTNSK